MTAGTHRQECSLSEGYVGMHEKNKVLRHLERLQSPPSAARGAQVLPWTVHTGGKEQVDRIDAVQTSRRGD